MTSLQERVLQYYIQVHKNPTIKFMAADTKIQISRLFRILNGHEMKISEFEKFQESIQKKAQLNHEDYKKQTGSSFDYLSAKGQNDIAKIVQRKAKLTAIHGGHHINDTNASRNVILSELRIVDHG
ncbi:MAG: hypothetical protein HQK50_09875 [Oligoflexia bacterium]|nr:hypothetical protein [Oligoflexia bacterium]